MGAVKDMVMAYQEQELAGEIGDDLYLAWVDEMERIMNEHTLADYVVLANGVRCYIGAKCEPTINHCECA